MIEDDKYLVEENDKGIAGGFLSPREYFVLRRGDVLAISTLRSYANNAMIMLELQQAGVVELTQAQDEHLSNLAMYASELADEWEQDPTLQLPD